MENQYKGGNCLKKRGLGQLTDVGWGAWQERGGGVFEGGLIPNAHY